MNKSELVKAVAEKTGLTAKDVASTVDALLETVVETLKKGDNVQLVGFGNFEVKDVAAKTCVNPKTMEKINVPACKKPAVKFAKALKDSLNA